MNKIKYVCGFFLSEDLRAVALIIKNRPDWQRGKLNGIGGKVEPGEEFIDAMIREFREEAGVDVTDWTPFAVLKGKESEVMCYYTTGDVGLPRTVTDESVVVIPVEQVGMFATVPNLQWLLPLAVDDVREQKITVVSYG